MNPIDKNAWSSNPFYKNTIETFHKKVENLKIQQEEIGKNEKVNLLLSKITFGRIPSKKILNERISQEAAKLNKNLSELTRSRNNKFESLLDKENAILFNNNLSETDQKKELEDVHEEFVTLGNEIRSLKEAAVFLKSLGNDPYNDVSHSLDELSNLSGILKVRNQINEIIDTERTFSKTPDAAIDVYEALLVNASEEEKEDIENIISKIKEMKEEVATFSSKLESLKEERDPLKRQEQLAALYKEEATNGKYFDAIAPFTNSPIQAYRKRFNLEFQGKTSGNVQSHSYDVYNIGNFNQRLVKHLAFAEMFKDKYPEESLAVKSKIEKLFGSQEE